MDDQTLESKHLGYNRGVLISPNDELKPALNGEVFLHLSFTFLFSCPSVGKDHLPSAITKGQDQPIIFQLVTVHLCQKANIQVVG